MSQQTPSQYVHNKLMRLITLYRVVDGRGHYVLDGYELTEKEFFDMFPLALNVRQKKDMSKENIDTTRSYLG